MPRKVQFSEYVSSGYALFLGGFVYLWHLVFIGDVASIVFHCVAYSLCIRFFRLDVELHASAKLQSACDSESTKTSAKRAKSGTSWTIETTYEIVARVEYINCRCLPCESSQPNKIYDVATHDKMTKFTLEKWFDECLKI